MSTRECGLVESPFLTTRRYFPSDPSDVYEVCITIVFPLQRCTNESASRITSSFWWKVNDSCVCTRQKPAWSQHDKSKVGEPRCYTIKIVCVFLRFHSGLRDFLFAFNNGTASFSKSSAILVTHKRESKCSSERSIMIKKKKKKLYDLLNQNQARINIVTMRIQPTFLYVNYKYAPHILWQI